MREIGQALETSRRMLQWAMLNPDAAFYRDVVATGAAHHAALGRGVGDGGSTGSADNEDDLQVHVKFWEDWVRAFDRERDLKIRGQKSLLRTLEKMGDERAAERLARPCRGGEPLVALRPRDLTGCGRGL